MKLENQESLTIHMSKSIDVTPGLGGDFANLDDKWQQVHASIVHVGQDWA
jgi:hypothetical protein